MCARACVRVCVCACVWEYRIPPVPLYFCFRQHYTANTILQNAHYLQRAIPDAGISTGIRVDQDATVAAASTRSNHCHHDDDDQKQCGATTEQKLFISTQQRPPFQQRESISTTVRTLLCFGCFLAMYGSILMSHSDVQRIGVEGGKMQKRETERVKRSVFLGQWSDVVGAGEPEGAPFRR